MSDWHLTAFTDEQKRELYKWRMLGIGYDQITDYFMARFPEYMELHADIPANVFTRLFTRRLKILYNSDNSNGKFYIEAAERGEIPIPLTAVPMADPNTLLKTLQNMFDELPLQRLIRVVHDEKADKKIEVYENNANVKLSIAKEIVKLLQLYGIIPSPKSEVSKNAESDKAVVQVNVTGREKAQSIYGDRSDADTEQTEQEVPT